MRDEEPVPISVESDGADGLAALLASSSRQNVDLVVSVNDKYVLVIEMKWPTFYRRIVSSDIPILWDLGDRVGGLRSGETQAGDPVHLEAV